MLNFRSRLVSGCMFFFGLVMMCQGFGKLYWITISDIGQTNVDLVSPVKNYSGLLAARFFLGLAESGTFPGCMCGNPEVFCCKPKRC